MSRKMGYYLLFGFIGFLITYAVSAGNNLFMTSFIRGLIAFVVWFLLAFAANWVITFLKEQEPQPDVRDLTDALKEQDKGASLDLTTPDQSEELNDLLKQTPEDQSQTQEFTPLNPPKLVKTLDDKDPEELAKVVRHLTDK
ncbi:MULTISPECIES: DUF3784 domain-containing protein [Paenibacillus]|uniref:DUF3784 domain-containing protein n=1 Tax=Paenibacillus TaxID=44249 RepID=UPI002FE41DD2